MFFGTSEFAVPSLRMVAQKTDLIGVVTQPDRPAGRGHRLRPTPVKSAAIELGVPVHQPSLLKSFAAALFEAPDLAVLAAYGKILPAELLKRPALGALNVHPSLLPKYRGATPLQTALRNGDSETGVTIILMDAGIDSGDIVLQERTPIAPDETYGELHERLSRFGAQALGHALDLAASGYIPHRRQDGKPSFTKPLSKSDLNLNWAWPATKIVNVVRALSPPPAARAILAGVPVKIQKAHFEPANFVLPLAERGSVVGMSNESLFVRCGEEDNVAIDVVVAPAKPPMSGLQFARSTGIVKA